jgi:predicted phage tail protein
MRTLFILISFMIQLAAAAQVKLQLIMGNNNPPAQINEWSYRRDLFTIIATLQGTASQRFILKTEIKTMDGTLVASNNLATAKVITVQSGTTVLSVADFFQPETLSFTGSYQQTFRRTGKLPAGQYQLCIRAVTPADFIPVTEELCRNFFIVSYQLPILMQPLHEAELNSTQAQTAIIFRWSPLAPAAKEPVQYRIMVFEVLQNQSPVQALRSNQPLLNEIAMSGITQYIWKPQLDFSFLQNPADTIQQQQKTFIWTVQTLDRNGIVLQENSNEGRSEPFVFRVKQEKVKK